MKLNRDYTMLVQVAELAGSNNTVQINHPLTLSFDITRNTLASANTGRFQIYNLKESTRRLIFHERWQTLDYRQIVLRAGYESDRPLPVIFQGNLVSALSYRSGPDWITEIEAFDGGFGILNGQVSQTYPAGVGARDVMRSLMQTMPKVLLGAIGEFSRDSSRGLSLSGNSWNYLGQLAGGGDAFIDGEQANVIQRDEYVQKIEGITVLNSATGLIGAQRRFKHRVDATMIFEPRVSVGQKIRLESSESVNNGDYKVMGITHRGIISGSVGGAATTVLILWPAEESLEAIP